MSLKHIGRLVPDSLKVDPKEAARLDKLRKLNQEAALILKSVDYDVPRTKMWIANNKPSEELLQAMRRVHREYFTPTKVL